MNFGKAKVASSLDSLLKIQVKNKFNTIDIR